MDRAVRNSPDTVHGQSAELLVIGENPHAEFFFFWTNNSHAEYVFRRTACPEQIVALDAASGLLEDATRFHPVGWRHGMVDPYLFRKLPGENR